MSFLNPFILFGLFAASLPILIHLLTRTKSRIIPFSTLAFLKELQNQQIRRFKLRQLLLLFLRTLILIFIVLAFARPSLRGSLSGVAAPNAKSSLAIILDNSVSMTRPQNGTPLFLLAKAKAAEIKNQMRAGDECFILTTTDTTDELSRRPFHDADILSKVLSDIKINYQATNISAAVELAHRLLNSSANINKEIYLISDLQQTGFSSDSLKQPASDIRLYVLPITSASIGNLAIENVQFGTSIVERGKVAQVVATFVNTGDRDINNALAQLFVNEKAVAQLSMQVDAGSATTQVFRFTVEQTGFSSARLVLEDDDILADNERTFSFFVPEKIRIGLSGFRPEDTFYASLVLDQTGIGPDYYSVENISLANLRYFSLNQIDVLLLSNIPTFDQQIAEKIKQFVEDGGGLIFVLGENIDIRVYNSVLVPLLKLPLFIDIIGSLDGLASDFTLGAYDLTHPIFFGIFEKEEAEIAKPRFHFAVKVAASSDIDPILNYSNGDPLLFEKKLGQGTILVLTTGFNEELSDITHRTIFAPLMIRMVGYAGAAGAGATSQLFVGEKIRKKIQPEDINRILEMRLPQEKYDRLKPTMNPSGAWIDYSETTVPGLYELVADGNVLNVWAVQLDPRESEIRPIESKKLQENFSAVILDANTKISDFIVSQRHGAELWKYFAIAAFVLLLVEMLLYREKGEVPADKVV